MEVYSYVIRREPNIDFVMYMNRSVSLPADAKCYKPNRNLSKQASEQTKTIRHADNTLYWLVLLTYTL